MAANAARTFAPVGSLSRRVGFSLTQNASKENQEEITWRQ